MAVRSRCRQRAQTPPQQSPGVQQLAAARWARQPPATGGRHQRQPVREAAACQHVRLHPHSWRLSSRRTSSPSSRPPPPATLPPRYCYHAAPTDHPRPTPLPQPSPVQRPLCAAVAVTPGRPHPRGHKLGECGRLGRQSRKSARQSAGDLMGRRHHPPKLLSQWRGAERGGDEAPTETLARGGPPRPRQRGVAGRGQTGPAPPGASGGLRA